MKTLFNIGFVSASKHKNWPIWFWLVILPFIYLFSSCKKFVEIDAPKNSIVVTDVFKNNDLATSALLGIYQQMSTASVYSGDLTSLQTICGLTADEFIGYGQQLAQYNNQITPENHSGLYSYTRIYDANVILDGLNKENGITPPVKNQLMGEALFIRAFCYYYLVNLYGEIPLQLSTDYRITSKLKRSTIPEVYDQILKDLTLAETLLGESYVTAERVRPNRHAVQALLSRVYLYMGDWQNTEKYSSLVISKNSLYKLVDLEQVFLSSSQEAIWQLMPDAGKNTPAGSLLVLTTAPTNVSLSPQLAENGFEPNDKRKTAWIRSIAVGGTTYYFPYKYKVKSSSTVTEYSMVFRLAEQFLIRSEAKCQQGKFTEAINDLNIVRSRAGLIPIEQKIPQIGKENLLDAIQQERKVELFCEWGHRWFDLKRSGKATAILSQVKPKWNPIYLLFPIPVAEIMNNNNITQNPGY